MRSIKGGEDNFWSASNLSQNGTYVHLVKLRARREAEIIKCKHVMSKVCSYTCQIKYTHIYINAYIYIYKVYTGLSFMAPTPRPNMSSELELLNPQLLFLPTIRTYVDKATHPPTFVMQHVFL